MDIASLTNQIVEYVVPALPYVVGARDGASGEVAGGADAALGEEVIGRAGRLWKRLQPAVSESPAATEAVIDVVRMRDDDDAKAALRLQVRKLLEHDAALASAVAQICDQARHAQPAADLVSTTFERGWFAASRDVNINQLNVGD